MIEGGNLEIKEKCYWCGVDATSKEHVPPKCLFPEDKDIQKIAHDTFRKNLITVPSCDAHNLEKSHEDEYLMACLGGGVLNNEVAYIHTHTKIKLARDRNITLLNLDSYAEAVANDKRYPVHWINIETHRLLSAF